MTSPRQQRLSVSQLGQLSRLAAGGQAVVYSAPGVKSEYAKIMVYKEYKADFLNHLDGAALEAFPTYLEALPFLDGIELLSRAAWPYRVVDDGRGISGFVMPEIPPEFSIKMQLASGPRRVIAEFQHLLNEPDFLARRGIGLTDRHRYELLTQVAEALTIFHRHRLVVGDLSPKNLLFSLSASPAVYFIDCDAMRLQGRSVTHQLETPGWEVAAINPAEELSTVATDSYKFGLLALRLLAGHQDTRSMQRLPPTVPEPIRQLIADAIAVNPSARPTPRAWAPALSVAAQTASIDPPARIMTTAAPGTPVGHLPQSYQPSLSQASVSSLQPKITTTVRHSPRWLWIAAVLFAVAVVVGTAIVWASSRPTSTVAARDANGETNSSPSAPSAPPPAAGVAAEPGTTCGPDESTAVQSALAQVPPPQIAGAKWSAQIFAPDANYDPCADLSTVLITVEGATGSSPQQALMFHRGVFLGTGTMNDYAFMSLNRSESTNDTVVLSYRSGQSCTACGDGAITTVRYHWDGAKVQMLDPPPPVLDIVPSAGANRSQLVRTESGKVRCAILSDSVGCQYLPGFPQAPVCDSANYHCDIANLTPAGSFSWIDGNIPGARPQDDAVLTYGQTYHFLGWTFQADESGTRVTNDGTGRGMFVSVDDVHSI